MPKRKPIEPHTPVRVEISIRESELIREHCFLAVDLLRSFNRSIYGKTLVAMLTLDDIEDFTTTLQLPATTLRSARLNAHSTHSMSAC